MDGKGRLDPASFWGPLLNFGGELTVKLRGEYIINIVGGWTNPFEKYARQIGNLP